MEDMQKSLAAALATSGITNEQQMRLMSALEGILGKGHGAVAGRVASKTGSRPPSSPRRHHIPNDQPPPPDTPPPPTNAFKKLSTRPPPPSTPRVESLPQSRAARIESPSQQRADAAGDGLWNPKEGMWLAPPTEWPVAAHLVRPLSIAISEDGDWASTSTLSTIDTPSTSDAGFDDGGVAFGGEVDTALLCIDLQNLHPIVGADYDASYQVSRHISLHSQSLPSPSPTPTASHIPTPPPKPSRPLQTHPHPIPSSTHPLPHIGKLLEAKCRGASQGGAAAAARACDLYPCRPSGRYPHPGGAGAFVLVWGWCGVGVGLV